MRLPFHSSLALRTFCLFTLGVLSLLTGCGKLRSRFAHKEAVNPHSATITWAASVSPVAGYNVYRESESKDPVKLTTRIVSGLQYTDNTVEAGHTYSYSVTAVDFKGLEGRPSEKITVTIPWTVPPPAPQ